MRTPDSELLIYAEYLATRKPAEDMMTVAADRLKTYPKDEMGLTPDAAKDDAWYADMSAIGTARTFLQRLARKNRAASRYKKEMRAESQSRRAKWGQPPEVNHV